LEDVEILTSSHDEGCCCWGRELLEDGVVVDELILMGYVSTWKEESGRGGRMRLILTGRDPRGPGCNHHGGSGMELNQKENENLKLASRYVIGGGWNSQGRLARFDRRVGTEQQNRQIDNNQVEKEGKRRESRGVKVSHRGHLD
jgi:hypothetical protein